jgi:hypothetical protein
MILSENNSAIPLQRRKAEIKVCKGNDPALGLYHVNAKTSGSFFKRRKFVFAASA